MFISNYKTLLLVSLFIANIYRTQAEYKDIHERLVKFFTSSNQASCKIRCAQNGELTFSFPVDFINL